MIKKNIAFRSVSAKRKQEKDFLLPVLIFFFLICGFLSVQAQQVKATVDTGKIKIGEQISYSISVQADEADQVVFPGGQTFSPFEMVESFSADTLREDDSYQLRKKYALTHWDSGTYHIPRQRVLINNTSFLTDSLPITVNTVAVDTTKQKMFPIKPEVEVPVGDELPDWVWWMLALFIAGALATYFFLRRRRKKSEASRNLPPFEQAIADLEQLDRSELLEHREIKEYYSRLSAAVRRYLDGEVYDHAMESTTRELIQYLKKERKQGRLQLSDETLTNLQIALDRADLAKFANSRPDVLTAREDRKRAEKIITDTKASLPEPEEEDSPNAPVFAEQKKRKRKRVVLGSLGAIIIVIAATTALFFYNGSSFGFDSYFSTQSSRNLLEGEWIRSEYGTPPVTVTTPEVLVRSLDTAGAGKGLEIFKAGDLDGNLYVDLSTRPAGQGFTLDKAVDQVLSYLEQKGARNIITKQENFTTLKGAEGLKIFGSLDLKTGPGESIAKEYIILNFSEGGGYQQLVLLYNEEDEYAEEIAQRISDSVELRNEE